MYFVTFDFVTLRRSIRCENSQSKILLLYYNIIITHNNILLHFRKVLIVTNSHVTKAHIEQRKWLTLFLKIIVECGVWNEE